MKSVGVQNFLVEGIYGENIPDWQVSAMLLKTYSIQARTR